MAVLILIRVRLTEIKTPLIEELLAVCSKMNMTRLNTCILNIVEPAVQSNEHTQVFEVDHDYDASLEALETTDRFVSSYEACN